MGRLVALGVVALQMATSLAVLAMAPPVAAAGQVAVYMTALNWPIALAFAPDGRIFFAERLSGSIRIIEDGTLLATPFYTLTDTHTAGERGLLGLALDPGFPSAPYVYAYQTYNDAADGTTYNRIVRIQANGNAGVSHSVILRLPPLTAATNHNGGVIAFGPDGKLYAVVGENANPSLAQDPMSPMGKVLRMNADGSAPTDNPFSSDASWNPLVYTYGHRNMFGIAWHPVTGRVFVTENGPNCNDEVNLLAPRENFGWGPTATCSTPPPPPSNTNRDGPNPVPPIWWWGSTICPTNAAIYGGPYFPAWQGDLFMGDCNFRRLHRLHLVPPAYESVASDTIVWTAPSAVIDVEVGPDGAIWFTTPTTIYRYWDSGQPPSASFTASPDLADVGMPIAFDAGGSSDPDGTIVAYAWDFGDSVGVGATGVTASHIYTSPGTYPVTLTVTDNESFRATTSRDILVEAPPTPGNRAPQILSSDPRPEAVTVAAGATQTFAIDASDPDGDPLTHAWRIDGTAVGGDTAAHNFSFAVPGIHRVNVMVSDGSLAAWREWTVTVVAPESPLSANAGPIGALVAGVLAAVVFLWWWRNRRRKPEPPPPSP